MVGGGFVGLGSFGVIVGTTMGVEGTVGGFDGTDGTLGAVGCDGAVVVDPSGLSVFVGASGIACMNYTTN